VNSTSSSFHAPPLARIIDQHVPHHLRSHGEEMRPIPPTRIGAGQKTQEGLLHQGGRLHGVILPFLAEMPSRQPMQLSPNQR
jgi:hypothetical protein